MFSRRERHAPPELAEPGWTGVFRFQSRGREVWRWGLFPYAKGSEGLWADPECWPGPDGIRLVFLASVRVVDGSIIVCCGESYIGRIRCPDLGE